jgi:hypothetical protein
MLEEDSAFIIPIISAIDIETISNQEIQNSNSDRTPMHSRINKVALTKEIPSLLNQSQVNNTKKVVILF